MEVYVEWKGVERDNRGERKANFLTTTNSYACISLILAVYWVGGGIW